MAKKNDSKEKEKNKELAILEAAEQEFMEKGYEAAKTTKIASLAGVTHAMLHYYFRTKENLFDLVFDKNTKILKESLFSAFENPDMPFIEKIQAGMEAHFEMVRANAILPRFVINELIYKPKRLSLLEKKIKKLAASVAAKISIEIEREVKKGTINPIDPVTLMIDIASMNIFVFAVLPLLRIFAVGAYESEDAFLEARKKENIEIIMRRLKK